MDRRQRKTRAAIFEALISLLNEKSFEKITVGEIIERADIGRATFYAHFETKDFLLRELCHELFCHVFDCMQKEQPDHNHIFSCNAPDSVFLHLFEHLEKNDNHILDLLSCRSNELFLSYFKSGLVRIISNHSLTLKKSRADSLPPDFVANYIASAFVETAKWWIENSMNESPEEINRYFSALIADKDERSLV